ELALEAQDQLQDSWVEHNWRTVLQQDRALSALGSLLRGWCLHNPKPLVLLFDEIDSLIGLSLISVLRQLRLGYPKRPDRFPSSVVLCGLRHLRDYRMELGDEGEYLVKGGSPFNIHSDSLRLGDFSQDDITTLYAQHTQETGQRFAAGVCERVFELTQGQPWLVNALAYEACFRDEAGRDRSTTISAEAIDIAKERLIQRRETHLDQLMAKLQQDRVQRVIEPILQGEGPLVRRQDVEYVVDLGLLKQAHNGELSFSNPIYREIIPRELSADFQMNVRLQRSSYVNSEGQLCMQELLQEFQQFFRENSDSWLEQFQYKEAGPHLILQAFLQRVINGGGSIYREYALGRGRTDLLVVWPRLQQPPVQQRSVWCQRVVLELKLIHDKGGFDSILQQGLQQTSAYMDSCKATQGHLLLFDRRQGKSWDERIWVKRQQAVNGQAITVWGL
ncbi:MAG: ATP-binding protein, partial [Myxococcota bacterium]